MITEARRALIIKHEELKRTQEWYKANDLAQVLGEGEIPPVVDLDFDFYIDLLEVLLQHRAHDQSN